MENIAFRFEVLQKFKEYFVTYYETDLKELDEKDICIYLGIVEGE